ncbi:MAG: DNA polymerase domain-containing protein [Candidatus Thorarchaeota archaeon]
MKEQGWLLDASIDHRTEALTLWIKVDGKTTGYAYRKFHPVLYVTTSLLDSSEWSDESIFRSVQELDDVVDVEVVLKFASVYDHEKSRVLRISTVMGKQKDVAEALEHLPDAVVFHADIDPVQQFFIDRGVFPFGRVEFEQHRGTVTKIQCLDSREDAEYEMPDLVEAWIDVYIDSESLFPKMDDPIHHIDVRVNDRAIRVEDDDERETLLGLQRVIDQIDPDVIVSNGGDEHLFRYLTLRSKINETCLTFSRDGSPLNVVFKESNSFWAYNQIVFKAGNQVMFKGRIHIDRRGRSHSAIEGVIEGCRLAFSRPQKVARMSIGTVNASVQYYTAHEMDILIPPVKRNPEFLKSITDLATIDRGGLIVQPKPGVYENIVEVDFSSMYPTLMVTRNISPETICTQTQCQYDYRYCTDIPGLSFKLCTERRGIISKSLEIVIRKRDEFKKLIKKGDDTKKYSLMQNTLKGVLVSCFGYLGFKNAKFGRVEAHTAVCALAREVLLQAQEIGEELGFETIHGIVDSLWVRSVDGIDFNKIQEFCERVSEAVDIDMSLKGIYRWFVIPSSRMHPSIAPLNRYYGVYRNGGIKTRGIETRRRDTCLYVGDCQKAMIETLARGRNKEEFIERIPKAYEVCQEYINRLWNEDVDIRDLVLHTRLTREPSEYRATSRAAIVAKQLVQAGRDLHAGQRVRYILTNADSPNPLRRVKALELFDDTTRYDPEAYARLCKRAFESLIPNQYLNQTNMEMSEYHTYPLAE